MLAALVSRYRQIKPRMAYYLPMVPVIAVACGIFYIYGELKKPMLCSSEAKIVVSGKINLPETANAYKEELANFLGTQIEILGSAELAAKAQRKMQLDHPELAGSAQFSARPVVGTTIIELHAVGSNGLYVAQLLQATLDEFIEWRRDRRIETTDAALKQIREEIPRTERQLAIAEDALFKFKQQHNMGYWDREASGAGQLLSELKGRESNLRMQLKMAAAMKAQAVTEARESRLRGLEAFDVTQTRGEAAAADAHQSPALDTLREQLIKLQVEREQLLTTFKPKHPRVQKVDQEIRNQSRVIQLLTLETDRLFEQTVAGMQSELGVITQAIADCEKKALESAFAAAEYERLQSNLALSREVHSRLASGLQNVDVSREVNLDMVQIMEHPTPAIPLPRNLSKAVINGLLAGSLAAFGCVLALTKIDQRAFSEEEIAEAAGVAVTAEVPPIEELADPDYLPAQASQPLLMREAMRSLAAALELSRDGEINHKVILFSSSTPNEGKSTLAVHFAVYLAKSGFTTLLIDGDLRRGCIGETFGLDPRRTGLAEGLPAGLGGWRLGIHTLPDRKLSVLPRGNTSGETFDSLPRGLSRELFFELKTEYDAIVIDSSPLIPVSDSIAFLQYADHVLLVSRVKVTKLDLLKKTAAIIRKSARDGFRLVANDLKGDPHLYGYGYHEKELAQSAGRRVGSRAPTG